MDNEATGGNSLIQKSKKMEILEDQEVQIKESSLSKNQVLRANPELYTSVTFFVIGWKKLLLGEESESKMIADDKSC